jgi:hypothetical protein
MGAKGKLLRLQSSKVEFYNFPLASCTTMDALLTKQAATFKIHGGSRLQKYNYLVFTTIIK